MNTTEQMNIVDDVVSVVVDTLGLTGEAAVLSADTALLGGISEFDSLAVVELIAALENRFGIVVDDEDVTMEVFATIGSVADFVRSKQQSLRRPGTGRTGSGAIASRKDAPVRPLVERAYGVGESSFPMSGNRPVRR